MGRFPRRPAWQFLSLTRAPHFRKLALFIGLLTLSLSPLPVNAQTDWVTLFQDNFENGNAGDWLLETGWLVELEGSNHVLSGSNHSWASLNQGQSWGNYRLKIKVKLINDAVPVHLNFRHSSKGRYFLGFHSGGIYFQKEAPWGTFYSLGGDNQAYNLNQWHEIEIIGVASHITVNVNGITRLDFNDVSPLLFGSISLETHKEIPTHFDDVLVIGEPPPLPPAGYKWIRTGGPSGGLGYDVRISPSSKEVLFVTDNPSGVNKSIDGGKTWLPKNSGINCRTGPSADGIPIFSLTIDPNNPNIIWAGTQNVRGIYKSLDGGETWIKKDNGVLDGDEISFRNFGVHPQNSQIVFAGAEITTGVLGREFDKTKGKIYKTEDGGENWRCVWQGDNLVRFILFNHTDPSVLYASTGIFDREAFNTEGVGILKSLDGGETWFPVNNGIPNNEGNRFLGFLEMHPTNPQILLAASGNNAKGKGGIFRTKDGGGQWQQVLSGDNFTVVTFSPSNPQVVYAGSAGAFYRSDDGGENWQRYSKPGEGCWGPPGIRPGVPISAVVDPQDPNVIFANNYGGGNFKSTDGGQTWGNSSKGYTGAHLHDIAVSSQNSAVVYTIGRSGPFRSLSMGESWAGLTYSPVVFSEWNAVALDPADLQQVLISDEHNGVILRSTDGGLNWTLVFRHPLVYAGDPTNRHGFKAMAYSPSNPSTVYAGMRKERRAIDGDMPIGPSYGMYKSTDSGQIWNPINNGLGTSLINIHTVGIHPTNSDIAYIGTWRDGIFKTTNGGQIWQAKNNGLQSLDIRSLAIDPKNPEIIYAGLGEGVGIFKSIDGGEQWEATNTGIQLQCPPSLMPVGKGVQGISFTIAQGISSGIDYYAIPWTSVWDIVIDPANSQNIYAADHQSGVYLSTDGGSSWLPINEGLTNRAVTALAISANGRHIYAATEGAGVFRLRTPGCCDIYLPLILKN
jgi:photosystem II stability/assembly factor-like uncharacterized protein